MLCTTNETATPVVNGFCELSIDLKRISNSDVADAPCVDLLVAVANKVSLWQMVGAIHCPLPLEDLLRFPLVRRPPDLLLALFLIFDIADHREILVVIVRIVLLRVKEECVSRALLCHMVQFLPNPSI